jgi:hypothetical protein
MGSEPGNTSQICRHQTYGSKRDSSENRPESEELITLDKRHNVGDAISSWELGTVLVSHPKE